jgi:hypothetical protein
MILDSEEQKRQLLGLVRQFAPHLHLDASEASLQQYAQLVELRRAIEAAEVASPDTAALPRR